MAWAPHRADALGCRPYKGPLRMSPVPWGRHRLRHEARAELMYEVPISVRPSDQLRTMAGDEAGARYDALVHRAREVLAGRCVWHVNATPEGGGVAELLSTTLGYLASDGIETRWLVIEAETPFFEITKRIHNRLHGDLGDGGPLGATERARYDDVMTLELAEMKSFVRSGDLVVVHDPQPLGLIPGLAATGATVMWTCHVGTDTATDVTRSAWAFLRDDVRAARVATFSRRAYAWEGLDAIAIVIPPCIDPLSAKNMELDVDDFMSILGAAGILGSPSKRPSAFTRRDGSRTPVRYRADMTEEMSTPADAPLVVQVSRWDGLKDPIGVMMGFVQAPELDDAHLCLVGPAPSSVADDPEADRVLGEVRASWADLRSSDRQRVHLANLPTDDAEENAVVVNALQRRADVIVQKSLAEGFGLTVTEAMWKARPVVAGGVGGIRDQIEHGVSGILVDPRELILFGGAVADVLADPVRAATIGAAARRSVASRYLPTHYLGAYLELLLRLT